MSYDIIPCYFPDEKMLSSRYDVPAHSNDSSNYYSPSSKPPYSSQYGDILSPSPTSSNASSPTPAFPISAPQLHPSQHRNYPRIAVPPVNALSPLPEEYPHHSSHHLSTLPRNHRGSLHPYDDRSNLRHDDDRGVDDRSFGGYRGVSGLASVGERYHLMHEVKANPKYVVRRGGLDLDDESFV